MSTRKKAAAKPLTIALTDLHQLLKPVLPHVDNNRSLPVLGCVSFATHNGWLTATATDRYTIGVSRLRVDPDVQFECLIQAAELKSLLAMFKPSRNGAGEAVTFTVDGPLVRVTGASAMFAEASVAYNRYEGEYPKVHQILDGADEPGEPGLIGINPQLLTRFVHAQRLRQPVVLSRPHPTRPLFVRAEGFLGAIMPARLSDDGAVESADEWLHSLGYKAEKKAGAA